MPDPALRDVNDATLTLVKRFEGLPDGDPRTVNLDPYLDPVGIWTIGWGHAIAWQGSWLRGPAQRAQATALYPGGITQAQAETLLRADLLDTGRDVGHAVQVPLSDNQYGALVSFTFNLGIGNLRKSTLLRKLNQSDYAGAADEFPRWNKADGKVFPGLVARRAAERELFLTA
jgi:lysozyme